MPNETTLDDLADMIASKSLPASKQIEWDVHMLRRGLRATPGERRFFCLLGLVIMAYAEFIDSMFGLSISVTILTIPVIGVSYEQRYERVRAWFEENQSREQDPNVEEMQNENV